MNQITETWGDALAVEHSGWFIGGEIGMVCYGCWHLFGIDVKYPCNNEGILDGMEVD